MMDKKAPDRIWVNLYPYSRVYAEYEMDGSFEYVRLDKVDALQAENERLRAALEAISQIDSGEMRWIALEALGKVEP